MISIVVVTYDSADCVERCLSSVREFLPDAELIVVDNGSQDETLRRVDGSGVGARVIECNENIGFGRACNIGAESAAGSHVFFLNPDAVVVGADAPALADLLAVSPFGLVAPALVGEREPRRAESSWSADFLAHTFVALRPAELASPRTRRSSSSRSSWVSGAMFLVLREEFLELGGFDARFFLYYEDRDLSRRYREAGLPMRATDAIRGRHVAGTSSAGHGSRADSFVWSLLGWIEYLWIHEDERAARLAARATLQTLRALRLGMRVLAALRVPRARRKAEQIGEFLRLLRERAQDDEAFYCPDAVRLIRGLA